MSGSGHEAKLTSTLKKTPTGVPLSSTLKNALHPHRRDRSRTAVTALCLVQAVDVLGVTVLIAALPSILARLHAPASVAGVLATSYAMAFGGLLMLGARLGDRLGPRRVLLAGLAGFAVASGLAGAAPSVILLVAARCLQGAAAAASVPAALRLLSEAVGDETGRRRALAAWSAAGAAAGASGLLAGGLLTSLVGWRAVFWLNLPLAAALILTVRRTVPSVRRTASGGLDGFGALLLTAGLMSLILAGSLLESTRSRAWGASLALAGGALLAIFARVQRTAPNPLLEPATVRQPRLRAGAGAAFVNTATTSSAITLATLYLQDTRHVSPAATGLMLLPFSLCVVLGAGAAGRWFGTHDPALTMAIGLGLIAAGDGALLLPGIDVLLPACAGVAGLGIGLSSVGANTLGTDVPEQHRSAAAGILNTAAQLGTALGVSAAVLIAGASARAHLPLRGAPLSWALAAALAAGAALIALRRARGPVTESLLSGTAMTAGGYAFGEDRGREGERLSAVERAFDPPSRAALGEAGVQSGWRCWEVGAGRGSIANWLGEVVGPGGHVLATDLDDRWFSSGGAANVEFLAHDLTRDPLPHADFDLVHARFVLEHLDEPQRAVERLAGALRPGGVLVLEDCAGVEFEVNPATDVFTRLAPRWERAGLRVGWCAAYGRALLGHLRAACLRDLRGYEYRHIAPGGTGWRHVVSGLERLRPGLLEQGAQERELERAIASLGDGANLITGPPVVIAMARR
jgi:MFS family permease